MTETAELKWVTCPKSEDYATSLHRHLIRPGRDTTLCGTTWGADLWRGNSNKPFCPRCQERFETLDSAA